MFAISRPEKKILVAVLSILTGLCTVAFFLHRNSQRLIVSTERIEQAEEFKFHIQEIISVTVDMETGVRGYVMTGDENYMQPANQAIADIFLHIHQLNNSPGISERHADKIDQLRTLVDEKSTLSTRTIELRRQKGMEEAIALIAEGKEKELMDQIRNLTGSMLRDEETNLGQLKEKHISVISHFGITFYFMLLKISVTVITVVFLLVLYFRRRKKAEEVLKANQALFQDVLDHSKAIISIKDLSGRYIRVNQAYEDLVHVPKEEIKGKTIFDLFDHDVAVSIRDSDQDVIKKQAQLKFEELVPKNGEMRHFHTMKFPLFDANHIPYAICSIATDETEKVKTESEQKDQMKLILDLFNNAPCGYQSTDKNGIVIEMNDTLLKWLGYTREEVIGKISSRSLLSKESQEIYAYYFPRIRSGEINSVFDVEVSYVRKDESKFRVIANSIAQVDEQGNFLYTKTSLFDISFRKQVEELMTHN